MNLQMITPEAIADFTSRSQMARIVTESWGAQNLYCVACDENQLAPTRNNNKACDFECASCDARYEMKSSAKAPKDKIVDSAYSAMKSAIESDRVPNLMVLHYSSDWSVRGLLLVPSFCFSLAALEKRKPLAPTARRAGWVGCNILLNAIAPDAKIQVVADSQPMIPKNVRDRFQQLRTLKSLSPAVRGWTLDVLRFARSLGKSSFSLEEIYQFEGQLAAIHPRNQNVRPKIRQQLQVLRDLGILRFVSRGRYEFVERR